MLRRHVIALPTAAALAAISAFAGLAGCAGPLMPRTVSVDEAELARLLARQFPRTESRAGRAVLTRSSPQIRLLPERNKLGARVDLGARERLSGRSTTGQLDLESALRFEPSDQSLRLAQVQVQDLQWQGARSGGLQRAAALLAERLLEDVTVYRLKPEQAERLARAGLAPGEVTVTSRGVELALVPAAR
jgi:hypothetical protein